MKKLIVVLAGCAAIVPGMVAAQEERIVFLGLPTTEAYVNGAEARLGEMPEEMVREAVVRIVERGSLGGDPSE